MKKKDKNLEVTNGIGSHGNRNNRDRAIKASEDYKDILERQIRERAADGWVWVKKGQTQKQIHPDKLDAHIQDGWRKISK